MRRKKWDSRDTLHVQVIPNISISWISGWETHLSVLQLILRFPVSEGT